MKAYQSLFTATKGKTVFIPFFVLGNPTPQTSLDLLKTALDNGADVLELGIPFSDPIADGPSIQEANLRALSNGINVDKAFEIIKQAKAYKDVPVGLLMYYNLIINYGVEKFYAAAAAAGVNSILIADLCIDDADEVAALNKKYGMGTVYIVTANTAVERQKRIAKLCSGFIYTAAVLGVTGVRDDLETGVMGLVKSLKTETDVPVCVGFGISKPEHAVAFAKEGVEGVIVGSAIVNVIAAHLDDHKKCVQKVGEFIATFKAALK